MSKSKGMTAQYLGTQPLRMKCKPPEYWLNKCTACNAAGIDEVIQQLRSFEGHI